MDLLLYDPSDRPCPPEEAGGLHPPSPRSPIQEIGAGVPPCRGGGQRQGVPFQSWMPRGDNRKGHPESMFGLGRRIALVFPKLLADEFE